MKIGIDARLYSETGVGRYIRNLVRELGTIDRENRYVIFLPKDVLATFKLPNARWEKRLADVPWHSVREQIWMPHLFYKERLDLVHIPYFNVPIFYFGAFVVTIHDLTILHFDTGKASTLPWFFYKLRRLGYYLTLNAAVHRAKKIIAVSETTKKEILDHFDVLPDDIVVSYEGIDENILKVKSDKPAISQPYFVYVGNAYPHKNLETLLAALYNIQNTALVMVGKDDYFYKRLKQTQAVQTLQDRIVFKTSVSDSELSALYRHAQAFVFPSFMEGFGLPALEALSLGCPVIVSDIPVFHELLGASAIYFDPHDADALAKILKHAAKKRPAVHSDPVKKYSWKKMAGETLTVYEDSARV